jgi:phenylacetate-coenzyme A ligase PaaK-like adenylate-forming protein
VYTLTRLKKTSLSNLMIKTKFFKLDKLYNYSTSEKKKFFDNQIFKLIKFHKKKSKNFKKIINNFDTKSFKKLISIPPLPITAFKKYDLLSIRKSEVIKVLRSSGTTGNSTSKIFLDSDNSKNQTWVLSKIMETIFGNKRLPMLIIEKEPNYNFLDRNEFNARIAAINGFSIFANNRYFIFNEKNKIDNNKLLKFFEKYCNEKFIIFGFTDQIFNCFYKKKINRKFTKYLKNGILVHGGGWKKLESQKVDNVKFNKTINSNYNINKIYNYYGLIEQTGSIFIECPECSSFKCSIYSDVILRDKNLNEIKKDGEIGLLQVMSTIPTSYPGNVILTEDLAEFTNKKKCNSCINYKGNRFRIHGRVKNSEIRGCANI